MLTVLASLLSCARDEGTPSAFTHSGSLQGTPGHTGVPLPETRGLEFPGYFALYCDHSLGWTTTEPDELFYQVVTDAPTREEGELRAFVPGLPEEAHPLHVDGTRYYLVLEATGSYERGRTTAIWPCPDRQATYTLTAKMRFDDGEYCLRRDQDGPDQWFDCAMW